MKMNVIVSAALALALSAGSAFAQANDPGDAAGQGEALQERFSIDNVMSDDPFGEIDVDMAMVGDQLRDWGSGLNEEQRIEVTERCGVITGNPANYDTSAVNFCNEFTASNPGQIEPAQ
jgi:hypothetical protein